MTAGNRRDGLTLVKEDGRSLEQNLDTSPPSYELAMKESHDGRPYSPLPTCSTEHRDTCVARTHHTSPTYPTLNIPLPINLDCNSSDPRNETSSPSAPYPTDESVYILSLQTSSSAFYNPMIQIPLPSGLGCSQTTGEMTQGSAILQGRINVPERNETPTISTQYLNVDHGSDDSQCVHYCAAVVGFIVITAFSIYIWRWAVERPWTSM